MDPEPEAEPGREPEPEPEPEAEDPQSAAGSVVSQHGPHPLLGSSVPLASPALYPAVRRRGYYRQRVRVSGRLRRPRSVFLPQQQHQLDRVRTAEQELPERLQEAAGGALCEFEGDSGGGGGHGDDSGHRQLNCFLGR